MEQSVHKLETSMAEFKKDIEYIKKSLDKNDTQHEEIIKTIKEQVECYVSVSEFKPIRIIVYGMVGFILLAFLSGVGAIVFNKI